MSAFPPAALFGSESFPPAQQSFPPSQFGASAVGGGASIAGTAAGSVGGGGTSSGGSHPPALSTQPSSGSMEAFFPPSGKSSAPSQSSPFSGVFTPSSSSPSHASSLALDSTLHDGGNSGLWWRDAGCQASAAPAQHTTGLPAASGNKAPQACSDDLLSFSDVSSSGRNSALGVTKAQILQMYASGPSTSHRSSGTQGRVHSGVPYAHSSGIPARPQPYATRGVGPMSSGVVSAVCPSVSYYASPSVGPSGPSAGSSALNNQDVIVNNNRYGGGWVVRGVAQQYPRSFSPQLVPRSGDHNPFFGHHIPAGTVRLPVVTAQANNNSSVTNANTVDLLQF